MHDLLSQPASANIILCKWKLKYKWRKESSLAPFLVCPGVGGRRSRGWLSQSALADLAEGAAYGIEVGAGRAGLGVAAAGLLVPTVVVFVVHSSG